MLSTVTAMDPGQPNEQPMLSEPVLQWSTRDGLLVPLPTDDPGHPLWTCVPGEPLLQGPLAMLLWLAGAVVVSPTPSSAAWRAVVDVDRAAERVPLEHGPALRRSFDDSGLQGGSRVELEVRLAGSAVETLDAELRGEEGVSPRLLLHLSIDAAEPAALPNPPEAGAVADADAVVRALALDWPEDLPVRLPRDDP